MKKKFITVIVMLLIIAVLVCLSFFIRQSIGRGKIPGSVTSFAANAKGVSYNIRDILEDPDEYSEAGMSGVMVYFGELLKNAPQLENLCEYESEDFKFFLFMLESHYNEFCTVFDDFSSSGKLTEEDFVFLTELKTSLDTLRTAMVKENGKADIRVLKEAYFEKIISDFSENEY